MVSLSGLSRRVKVVLIGAAAVTLLGAGVGVGSMLGPEAEAGPDKPAKTAAEPEPAYEPVEGMCDNLDWSAMDSIAPSSELERNISNANSGVVDCARVHDGNESDIESKVTLRAEVHGDSESAAENLDSLTTWKQGSDAGNLFPEWDTAQMSGGYRSWPGDDRDWEVMLELVLQRDNLNMAVSVVYVSDSPPEGLEDKSSWGYESLQIATSLVNQVESEMKT